MSLLHALWEVILFERGELDTEESSLAAWLRGLCRVLTDEQQITYQRPKDADAKTWLLSPARSLCFQQIVLADGDAQVLHRGPASDYPGERGPRDGQGAKKQTRIAERRRHRED